MKKIYDHFQAFFFRDRLILVSFNVGLIFNIVLWIVLLSKFGFGSERIPLHFSVVYGIDFVGDSWRIYQIPFLGLAILGANFVLGKIVYEREKLFSYFLFVTAAAVQLILGLAVFSLLSLG